MTTRLEKYHYDDTSKSRVAKNQELYQKIYAVDTYFQGDENSATIEKTNEINIDKVKELLKSREIYQREMRMRELNITEAKSEEIKEPELASSYIEKTYDINAYLNKASSEKRTELYHKIDQDIMEELPALEATPEPSVEDLKNMCTTDLSLDMFEDLKDDDNTKGLAATITHTKVDADTFFTDSVKLHLDDLNGDDEEETTSPFIKIVTILLILVIIGLVIFVILM